MKKILNYIVIFSVLLITSGCVAHKSVFLHPGPNIDDNTQDFVLDNPAQIIVVLFNQGTSKSSYYPSCNPQKRAPDVFKSMAGTTIAGKTIYVYYRCTSVTGDRYIHGRAKEIEATLDLFLAKGVPAKHIFLAGQSAGAWSSIVTARDAAHKFNAIIGVAPAFSGKKSRRNLKWQDYRKAEVQKIRKLNQLNALIYAFKDDAYNEISDLEFLSEIAGVVFVPLDWNIIEGVPCNSKKSKAHSTVYRDCFKITQLDKIKRYINKRINVQKSAGQ